MLFLKKKKKSWTKKVNGFISYSVHQVHPSVVVHTKADCLRS